MRILVINISLRPTSQVKLVPIGLAYVMTAMKNAGHDFELLDIDFHRYSDSEVESYLTANRFDVVCMGCIVTGYRYVKWLTSLIKKAHPQTTVVVGNTVTSSIPHIIFQKTAIDVAVMGEGEETVVELLNRLNTSRDLRGVAGVHYRAENGEVVRNAPRTPIKDLDTIPFPDWELFDDVEPYIQSSSQHFVSDPFPIPHENIRAFPISVSRGCLFDCTFCYHAFKGYQFRYRSPQSLVREMQWLKKEYGINYFLFHDDLSFFSRQQARETIDCFLASRLDVFWVASCRSGLFQTGEDLELAKDFKRAGCMGLSYSLESSDADILKMMKKKASPEMFARQRDILSKAGLATWTSLVIGYPTETVESIRKTIRFCGENGIYPSVGYLLPQPGTPMYDYAINKGFIADEEDYLLAMGDRQDLRLNMTAIPDDLLQQVVLEALVECSSRLGIEIEREKLVKTGYYRSKSLSKEFLEAGAA